jgi:acyl-CoA dehydrogenase
MAHAFAAKEIRPVASDYGRDGTPSRAIIDKAREVGLVNSQVPGAYEGAGAFVARGLPDRRGASLGLRGHRHHAGGGRPGVGSATAGRLGEAEAVVLGEVDRGAAAGVVLPDRSGRRLRNTHDSRRKGGTWVISGSKVFITTNGEYANWYTVYAKADKYAGHRGISAFVVPRDSGVIVDKHEDKMGLRSSDTAAITFEECEIQYGVPIAMHEVIPIAMHEAIQFMIADMAGVEAARLLTWRSAVTLDQGKRNTLASSRAKRFAAGTAMKVATDPAQLYGGYGFIKEYPVEKLMRDAKIMELYEGTSQIQRLVIARETLLPRRLDQPSAAAV